MSRVFNLVISSQMSSSQVAIFRDIWLREITRSDQMYQAKWLQAKWLYAMWPITFASCGIMVFALLCLQSALIS